MHGFRGPRGGARLGAFLLVAAVAVGGCVATGPSVGSGGAAAGSLVGRTFLSESVTENGQPRPLVDGTRIELTFTDEGQVTASAGCNSMFAPVEIGPRRLLVGDLSSTDMACRDDLGAQDEWLAGVLTADPAYALRGPRLRVRVNGTVIRLLDREAAQPDRPLEGTTWEVDGIIIGGDAVSSLPPGTGATLVFEGGTVGVRVQDCNQGSADVTISPPAIDVGVLRMTLRACEQAPAEVEAAVTRVLQGTISYTITGDALALRHPSGAGLTLRAS